MATYTLYQYANIALDGGSLQPPTTRETGLAFGAAKQLNVGTRYIKAIPDVDARFRISTDGAASTSADERIYADVGFAGEVYATGTPLSIYLIAA